MIKGFKVGHWYRWRGPPERPRTWNEWGRMDFLLDGAPHLCRLAKGIDGNLADFVGHRCDSQDPEANWCFTTDDLKCFDEVPIGLLPVWHWYLMQSAICVLTSGEKPFAVVVWTPGREMVGWSICSDDDKWNADEGWSIALERLNDPDSVRKAKAWTLSTKPFHGAAWKKAAVAKVLRDEVLDWPRDKDMSVNRAVGRSIVKIVIERCL